jgi:hypothetical protein
MAEELVSRIRSYYELEAALPEAERAAAEAEATLRQAMFDLRAAQEEEWTYSGSFRSLKDRFTGKKEEREATLRSAVQRAESALAHARRERDRANQDREKIAAELDRLPSREALEQMAREHPETEAEYHRLEARYCAAVLMPLLDENHRDLTACGKLLRGEYLASFGDPEAPARVEAAPGVSGRKCAGYLRRLRSALERLDMSLEEAPFFDDPAAYIVAAAARHNRLDRCRDALEQNEAMQRAIRRLKSRLEVI